MGQQHRAKNVATGHSAALQAAAIGVVHPLRQERPPLVVTLRAGCRRYQHKSTMVTTNRAFLHLT